MTEGKNWRMQSLRREDRQCKWASFSITGNKNGGGPRHDHEVKTQLYAKILELKVACLAFEAWQDKHIDKELMAVYLKGKLGAEDVKKVVSL